MLARTGANQPGWLEQRRRLSGLESFSSKGVSPLVVAQAGDKPFSMDIILCVRATNLFHLFILVRRTAS